MTQGVLTENGDVVPLQPSDDSLRDHIWSHLILAPLSNEGPIGA